MAPALTASALAAAILALLTITGRLRTIPREFPSRFRLALGCGLLWAVVYAAIALPAALASDHAAIPLDDLSFPSLFAGHAVLSVFLLAWWRLRRPISLARFLHLRGAAVGDLQGGIVLGFRVWLFTFGTALVAGLFLQLLLDTADSWAGAPIELPAIPDVMIWMVNLPIAAKLLIVLAAMTVEEAFFRAFLQSRIGLLPSSLLFAIAHASYGLPTLVIGVFIVSIVIGRDFQKNGQLLRCILAHGVFDAIQLLVVVPFAVGQLQSMQTAI